MLGSLENESLEWVTYALPSAEAPFVTMVVVHASAFEAARQTMLSATDKITDFVFIKKTPFRIEYSLGKRGRKTGKTMVTMASFISKIDMDGNITLIISYSSLGRC